MVEHILSFLIFTPLAIALALIFFPADKKIVFKWGALIATAIQLILSISLLVNFDTEDELLKGVNGNFQWQEKIDWISIDLGSFGKLSIEYFVGTDGLNITMVLLSAIVLFIGVISSWSIDRFTKGYFLLYLLLSASIMGTFLALDFFLFFLFFEFMLLPMYFLIGIWGGPRRNYASIKFFLYTLLGSVFILVVMIGLYISTIDPSKTSVSLQLVDKAENATQPDIEFVQKALGEQRIPSASQVHTFSIPAMTDAKNFIPNSVLSLSSPFIMLGMHARLLAFLFLFIGFAIKLPSFPFHTWLPDAHVEAPTPISVILAGLLLKIGGYGIIRIAYCIFPDGALHFAWWIGLLGVFSILYGAFNAMAMKDLKKLIAYSSVSHMGFVLLGLASLTTEGLNGAIFQMFSHGLISSTLFLIAGVIYDRSHDRLIENYSGLATLMPAFTVISVITFFASLGLPGLSGFIAEILIFLGSFGSKTTNGLLPHWFAIVAATSLVITAAYYLWTLQKMFLGKVWLRDKSMTTQMVDLNTREYIMLIPLILLIILLGIFPGLLLDFINTSANHFTNFVLKNGESHLKLLINK